MEIFSLRKKRIEEKERGEREREREREEGKEGGRKEGRKERREFLDSTQFIGV
jgi:hypothetical protein